MSTDLRKISPWAKEILLNRYYLFESFSVNFITLDGASEYLTIKILLVVRLLL